MFTIANGVVTDDGDGARQFLLRAFNGTTVHSRTVEAYGTRSVFVSLSDEVMIEIAEPIGPDSEAGHSARGMNAVQRSSAPSG